MESVKHTLVASSTMEEEFVACYEASNQAIWLRNFISVLQMVDLVERQLQLYCDNIAAELYCKSHKSLAKLRHINIKVLVVKDRVKSHIMSVDSISTEFNITYPLTKGLPHKVFLEHVARM